MNAVIQVQDYYRAAHAEARLPGDVPWLQTLRGQALAQFQGFPGARDEEWKYTRLTAIERARYAWSSDETHALTPESLAPYCIEAAHRLVFVNGVYAPALSAIGSLPTGVTVRSLAEALIDTPAGLEGRLGRIAALEQQPFVQLNTAFLAQGAYIHVPRGVTLETPVQLLFVSTIAQTTKMALPRIVLALEEQAQASVMTHYIALANNNYLTNAVTEVALDQGARLAHYTLQQEAAAAQHVSGAFVRLGRDAHYASQVFSLGAQLARNEIHALLAAPGATCELQGLYLAGGQQHLDHHTVVDHAQPHGTSRQLYKGIADGRSRGVFSGRVIVRPGAQKTDAQQTNKNLLLSADAETDARPQLEIYADDVKCSHGATVGQLDQDAVFYLRARGVDEAAARALLTYAFAREMVEQVTLGALRAQLERAILARLPAGHLVQELV